MLREKEIIDLKLNFSYANAVKEIKDNQMDTGYVLIVSILSVPSADLSLKQENSDFTQEIMLKCLSPWTQR